MIKVNSGNALLYEAIHYSDEDLVKKTLRNKDQVNFSDISILQETIFSY